MLLRRAELGRSLISSEDCVFTAPYVAMGKKKGVVMFPWPVRKTPVRADVSWSDFIKVKKGSFFTLIKLF